MIYVLFSNVWSLKKPKKKKQKTRSVFFYFIFFFYSHVSFNILPIVARRWFWCHWINDESVNSWRIESFECNGTSSAWVGIFIQNKPNRQPQQKKNKQKTNIPKYNRKRIVNNKDQNSCSATNRSANRNNQIEQTHAPNFETANSPSPGHFLSM